MPSHPRYHPPPRPRSNHSRHRSRNSHEDCVADTCKAVEERYGGFDWTEGLTLALMGAMALFSFDKAYDKHMKKSDERRSKTWAAGDEGDSRSRRGSYDDERERRYHGERYRDGRRTSSSRDWQSRSGSW